MEFNNTNIENAAPEQVDVKNIAEIFESWQKDIRTRFAGVPVKIDETLEGNQYYIVVSQELYNQIEKEKNDAKT